MELGMALVGGVCIAIGAMPFVLQSRSKKKKEQFLYTWLDKTAQENACSMTQHFESSVFAIGIDETKKAVLFVLKVGEAVEQQYIDLTTIKSCQLTTIHRPIGNNGKITERLYLKLIPKDKNNPEVTLEFYNVDVSFNLSNQFQAIDKWNKIINQLIK